MIEPLNSKTLASACASLAAKESHFAFVLERYGPPPLWDREPGFATLVHIILEQQVSLASAKACFDKLCRRLGRLTPKAFLTLNDVQLKKIGFSRQKTSYVRHLSETILEERLDLDRLASLPDQEVKEELVRLKGIGEWTSDIYLLMALLRPDVMPRGDIALHSAWHRLSGEPRPAPEQFLSLAERWSPHRSTAARLLWHWYLSKKAEKQLTSQR